MNAFNAKDKLLNWLKTKKLPSSALGKDGRCMLVNEGRENLLWLPKEKSTLYVFVLVKQMDPKKDTDILDLCMSLNLDPVCLPDTSLGYNPKSNQLMLRASYDIHTLDMASLDKKIAGLQNRSLAIRHYLENYRNQPRNGAHYPPVKTMNRRLV